jgi:N-acetylglutamate synthase/N-acetylornithine aminotransferase
VFVRLDLGTGGDGSARMWTCDLSADYVKINAEYRT